MILGDSHARYTRSTGIAGIAGETPWPTARVMTEYVGRLLKAGASEELEVLGVEKDADFQQVGELRALIARGTSYRMSNRTRRLSPPGLQRTARELASSLTETLG